MNYRLAPFLHLVAQFMFSEETFPATLKEFGYKFNEGMHMMTARVHESIVPRCWLENSRSDTVVGSRLT